MAERILGGGLEFGIVVGRREDQERLEKEFFSRWYTPVKVCSREERQIVDGVQNRYGGGRLAYLALDKVVPQASETETLVQIDRAGAAGDSLLTWGNVFAISYRVLTGVSDPALIEAEYFRTCFGDAWSEVRKAFALSRLAIEKSFLVFGTVALMDNGTFPESTEWLDRQVDGHAELSAPTRKTLSQIDLEKIDALEAAYDAWKALEGVRESMDPGVYVWIEPHFQELKTVCLVLRLLADVYFSDRAYKRGSLKVGEHVMRSKTRDFYATVREHRALLTAFDRRSMSAGADPLGNILSHITY